MMMDSKYSRSSNKRVCEIQRSEISEARRGRSLASGGGGGGNDGDLA
jgi:hypothetical protein